MTNGMQGLGKALATVMEGGVLEAPEARAAFETIMDGGAAPAQLAGFLVALRIRGETVGEIAAFARVMRERATPLQVDPDGLVDTCGTGGDGSGSFNISTLAAIVAAAAGVRVAKHGNRAVSSRCGSADLLQGLGVRVDVPVATIERSIRSVGLGFLFAPSLHGAMKHAVPVRRELGVRTVFNLLGPLTNPARARRQLLGVFDPAWVTPIAEVLRELGSERAMVVHGGGLDEIAAHAETRVAELDHGSVRTYTVTPEDAGLTRSRPSDIAGGDVEQNVAIARNVLQGAPGPRREVVLLNAAAALRVAERVDDLRDGVDRSARAIDSGAAVAVLDKLREICPVNQGGE
jgi:anthranilate phosphoribosyltransferase